MSEPHYDFNTLSQAVGPSGDLGRKPCPTLVWHESKAAVERVANCPGLCGGTGKVWDDQHPIVQALWEKCPGHTHDAAEGWERTGRCIGELGYEAPTGGDYYESVVLPSCHGSGYVPRPRAEAALRLPDAATKDGSGVSIRGYSSWEVTLSGGPCRGFGVGDNWLDALAAAIEAALRAEKP